MDKYDYIENIINFIRGSTSINYQLHIKEILRIYYKYKNKEFIMPDFYGGDQKNDGCVLEDGIFYQIFAPTRLKHSLKKEIQEKFTNDLSSLLKIIYLENKWNGKLNKFIFLVNTFDNNLPHDSENFFKNTVNNLCEQYSISFDFKVVNNDYIRDILEEINDIEVLKSISSALHIKNLIDYNAIDESIIINLIIEISGNLNFKIIDTNIINSYERISPIEKISINSLDDKKEEIENIILKLDVVENAINKINQDILYENKFERVKQHTINKYYELSKRFHGVHLYDTLINEILSYSKENWNLEIATKFLIVYIFDKCDIFEKERS